MERTTFFHLLATSCILTASDTTIFDTRLVRIYSTDLDCFASFSISSQSCIVRDILVTHSPAISVHRVRISVLEDTAAAVGPKIERTSYHRGMFETHAAATNAEVSHGE